MNGEMCPATFPWAEDAHLSQCEKLVGHSGEHVAVWDRHRVRWGQAQGGQALGPHHLRLSDPEPHPDAQEETAVEHLQNLRQMLVNLKADLLDTDGGAADCPPGFLERLVGQVEAADKRALKALVQLTRAGRLLAPGVRAVRP